VRGLLLDLGQSLFRVVLAREARRRVDRHGQCLAGALFVSSFQGRQAEMVLDDGLVRQFGRAVLEQVCGSLIHAALVEDPPQWIRDVRVVGIASLARWANSSALAPSRRVTHEPRRGILDTLLDFGIYLPAYWRTGTWRTGTRTTPSWTPSASTLLRGLPRQYPPSRESWAPAPPLALLRLPARFGHCWR